jgi:hypothetical protein
LDDSFCRLTKTHQEIGRAAILAFRWQGSAHATRHKVFGDLLSTFAAPAGNGAFPSSKQSHFMVR